VLRTVGTALLVIVVTALVANLGLLPTYGGGHPTYDALLSEGIGLAIFWLLLRVELRAVWRAGPALLGLFLVGALGIALGVPLAMFLLGGTERFDPAGAGLGAMFVGTYIGGSANFFALAEIFAVDQFPALVAGATVVDSLLTTVWMVLGVWLPRRLGKSAGGGRPPAPADLGVEDDTEPLHPLDLALLVALAAGSLAASRQLAAWLSAELDLAVHPTLVLTAIALLLAQVPAVARLRGTRTLGMFAVYLFLATIGALCDVAALQQLGAFGLWLLALASVALSIHGLLTFGLARLLRLPPELAAVASQANVGGGSSALALARTLGRSDLVLPAILIGSLGTALGTWVGLYVGVVLLGGSTVG
jgi:uncharacterized membrane protein